VAKNNGTPVTGAMKTLTSLFSGAVGAAIANPCDLALVRMQADLTLPVEQRRNYRHVFHAFQEIIKNEGFINMYTGCAPTVARAMSLNCSMLVSYDITKQKLVDKFGNSKLVMLSASWVSGGFVSVCSLPFDNMKTKMQKQTKGADGKFMYSNLRDCIKKTIAREGVTGLWTGLPTFYMRVAPHAMFTLLFAEFFKRMFGLTK
jgi:solute carrier family 25 oxoglutarate transporter 11